MGVHGAIKVDRPTPQTSILKERDSGGEIPLLQIPGLRPDLRADARPLRLAARTTQKKSECRPLAEQLLYSIEQLCQSRFAPLATLAHTLSSWSEEIACMWRFTKNNGITEGFHRKLKLIQRRAYGFRNFNNYRLRVLAQCS